jgi:hypothetical protein
MAKSDTKTRWDRMVRIPFTDCQDRNSEEIPPKNGSAKTEPPFLPNCFCQECSVVSLARNRREEKLGRIPAENPLPQMLLYEVKVCK